MEQVKKLKLEIQLVYFFLFSKESYRRAGEDEDKVGEDIEKQKIMDKWI